MGIGFWWRAWSVSRTLRANKRAGDALLAESARLAVLDDRINDLLARVQEENRSMTEQERVLLEELSDQQRVTLQRLEAADKRFSSPDKPH